ncbi:aminoglycoside phosphotransferase family protein [Succinatimonas hippei]|uniref:Phosphotransferase enzyme family n=1 Tax=Succinatimonas hippei (strain DSM 22608 / JCM 16073 / KCTC 15190 / YIT 12066) TaxID=762983 RepID=E8LJE6_SUCHY|nr:phosphotransferase [Succinatimonas hippei]EFY07369.1 phosphotransferase enzyme family [Succinatimonas hippei YIT 12066]MCL1602342.1 phosphotransferase [Succinatimonas hippei]
MIDLRKNELKSWLISINEPDHELIPLNGDASLRRYFIYGNKIAVDSPPASQKNREFIAINKKLHDAGIYVPQIFVYDLNKGFFLLENLGSTLFADVAKEKEESFWYEKAVEVLTKLAQVTTEDLPAFDRDFILFELSLFPEWMLNKTFNFVLDKQDAKALQDSFSRLADLCLKQPQIAMHRDFHSRNIMIVQDKLAVIDYQDMVKGPLTYDLASLLFDCYKVLPETLGDKITTKTFTSYKNLNLTGDLSLDEFKRDLIAVSLQRHLKVLGIFCRLNIRDHKNGYLKDLPRVLNYAIKESAALTNFESLHEFLKKLIPLVKTLCP